MKQISYALGAGVFLTAFLATTTYAQKNRPAPKRPAPAAVKRVEGQATGAKETPPVEQATASITAIEQKKDDSIKFSGLIRVRPEVKENLGFDSTNRFNFVGQKVWLTAEKAFSDKTRFVITLQDARVWGGQKAATGTDTSTEQQAVDVREAFMQLDNFLGSPLSLRLGRQKISLGDEMLVGVLDWANVGRSFDGARLIWDTPANNFTAFSTIVQEDNSNDPGNPHNSLNKSGIYFSGIYDTLKIHKAFWLDAYFFARNDDVSPQTDQLYTGGFRFHNATGPGNKTPQDQLVDYTLDVAYQGGRKGGLEVQAFGAIGRVGVNFNAGLKMRVGAQGAYASGDKDSTDNKYQTFNPLYPTMHSPMGIADVAQWSNITGAGGNYTVWFIPTLSVRIDYWYAERASVQEKFIQLQLPSDGLNGSTKRGLYHEIDLLVDYKPRDTLGFQFGYAYAMRGVALRDAGKNSDYQYVYLMSTFTF